MLLTAYGNFIDLINGSSSQQSTSINLNLYDDAKQSVHSCNYSKECKMLMYIAICCD